MRGDTEPWASPNPDLAVLVTTVLGASHVLPGNSPGAILELDRREEEPFDVLANGRVIARGEVVVVDERFGLRITEIGSSSERLRIAG